MSVTPEQVAAAAKTKLEAGLKSSVAAVNTVFAGVESLTALNLKTARASFDDGVAFVKAVAAVKDPKELAALQLGLLTPSVEKGIAYARAVGEIGSKVKVELTAQYEAEVASVLGEVNGALETLFKNAPAGSEAAVSAVKGALAQANAAYADATQKAKAVVAQAQAQLDSAAAAAVENLTKTTAAAASALKIAA
jgi:phasin family protein